MTTKPRHRLHVHEITSIGTVADGDSPESSILFYKKAPTLTRAGAKQLLKKLRIEMQRKNPAMSRAEVESEIFRRRPDIESALKSPGSLPSHRSGLSAADKTELVTKVRLDQADEQIAAMKKTTEESWKTLDEIRSMMKGTPMNRRPEGRSSATILAEVDRLANSIAKSAGEPMTTVEARVEVWRTHPELKTEIRKAQRLERKGGVLVDAPAKTVADRVREVVDEATRRAAWQPLLEGWGDGQTRNQIVSKVRVEVWRSPDGLELRDLERTHGAKPYTPAASAEIRKSRGGDRYARALNLLDSGIWAG